MGSEGQAPALLVTDNVPSNELLHYFVGAAVDGLNAGVHKSSEDREKRKKDLNQHFSECIYNKKING